MSRFELDLDKLPAPYSVTVTNTGINGSLHVLIGLRSAEDALAYAEHYGVPVESDEQRPLHGHLMRSVSALKTESGLTLFLAGSSIVDPAAVSA